MTAGRAPPQGRNDEHGENEKGEKNMTFVDFMLAHTGYIMQDDDPQDIQNRVAQVATAYFAANLITIKEENAEEVEEV